MKKAFTTPSLSQIYIIFIGLNWILNMILGRREKFNADICN